VVCCCGLLFEKVDDPFRWVGFTRTQTKMTSVVWNAFQITLGPSRDYFQLPGSEQLFLFPLNRNSVVNLNNLCRLIQRTDLLPLRKEPKITALEEISTLQSLDTVIAKYPVFSEILPVESLVTKNDCRNALQKMGIVWPIDKDEIVLFAIVADSIRARFKLCEDGGSV